MTDFNSTEELISAYNELEKELQEARNLLLRSSDHCFFPLKKEIYTFLGKELKEQPSYPSSHYQPRLLK